MLTSRQKHCLQGMGISLWQSRPAGDLSSAAVMAKEVQTAYTDQQDSFEHITTATQSTPADLQPDHNPKQPAKTYDLSNWTGLTQSIEDCQNCTLAQSCTRKVPGKGYQEADLMIIGEAPGHEEDLQGRPFVGRAGQVLDKMLMAIEIDPQQVYITNILKCRPPQNRDPQTHEVHACSSFLKAQIDLVNPKVIFSVGRISAQNLLQDTSPVGRLRGEQYHLPGTDIPLLVTYHPAYLLRNPIEKAKVWEDLKKLRRLIEHAAD